MGVERSVLIEGKAYLIGPCRLCEGKGYVVDRAHLCDVCHGSGDDDPRPYGYEPMDPPATPAWLDLPATVDVPLSFPVSTTKPFTKNDAGKNMLDLIPPLAHEEVGWCMTGGPDKGGAIEYGAMNCIAPGVSYRRYIGAAKRHLAAFERHADYDEKTGRHALGHAAASIMILLELCLRKLGTDDRWPKVEETQAEINARRGTEGGE